LLQHGDEELQHEYVNELHLHYRYEHDDSDGVIQLSLHLSAHACVDDGELQLPTPEHFHLLSG